MGARADLDLNSAKKSWAGLVILCGSHSTIHYRKCQHLRQKEEKENDILSMPHHVRHAGVLSNYKAFCS
jgi:hypothetical protein